jgi:HK97 family phage prohead protease
MTLELREQPSGAVQLEGIASRTNVWYPVGHIEELIEPGAFRRSLASDPDVMLLVGHGDGGLGLPLARTRPADKRTLHLSESAEGLAVRADLDPEDHDSADVIRKVRAGLVDAMSFAFKITKNGKTWDDTFSRRRISGVNLEGGDVSLVSRPANPHTSASIRSGGTLEERRRQAELLGDRLIGTTYSLRAAGDTCARCNGLGTVTLPCPNCGPDAGARGAQAPTVKPGAAEVALRAMLADLRSGPRPGRLTTPSSLEMRARIRAMQERERVRRGR